MAGSSAPILLKTKLHRLTLQTDFVPRAHLITRLQQGIDRKLGLIVAPAGFGKSTLVAHWLNLIVDAHFTIDGFPLRTCWLSLDRQDDSLLRFLNYALAAIHTAYADACPILKRTLQSVPLPPIDYLADLLAVELSELGGKLIFALDDFHLMENDDVQQFVEHLLHNAPATLHLVIITRMDPALPLARLRVQNQVTELRAVDLRFSVEEAEQFFARTLTIPLSNELVRTLDERAEGWAAGLRLASLSLQDHDDPQTLVAEFSGTQRHVMDFLLEQVLAHQPPEVVTFLLFTSPLEMLSAPLCNEVLTGATLGDLNAPTNIDSRAILNYLARSNLFLVALDSKGHWYRYHHLFRDMLFYWLQTQHPPATVERIHRQASTWFAHNGLLEPALRQLLAINDVEAAGDLIETAIPPVLGREAWAHLQELLGALPDTVISRRPVLLMAQAWLLSVMQRMNEVSALLHQVEELLQQEQEEGRRDSPPWLAGWVHALWSLTELLQWNLEASLAHAEQVLALTPHGHIYVRGIATTYYALALRASGRYADALAICAQTAIGEHEETQHRILATLGMLSTYQGDLPGVRAAGEQNLRAGGEWKITKPRAWGHIFLGSVEYETNNLEAARQHFLAAYDDRFGAAIVLGLDAAYGLALTFAAQGDKDSAAYWAGRMAALAREAENVYLVGVAEWFACRLALNEGATPPSAQRPALVRG